MIEQSPKLFLSIGRVALDYWRYHGRIEFLRPTGYKFSDFLRVGVPLAIIMWVGSSIVLPLLYDLG